MELENLFEVQEQLAQIDMNEVGTASEYEGVSEYDVQVYESLDGLEQYGEVIVTGSPFERAEMLDYEQGDNPYNAHGCCGLVSCSNFLNICGVDASESEIVGYAIRHDLCNHGFFVPPEDRGGTNDYQLESILEAHGVQVTAYSPENGGSIEDIAAAIDEGRAVTIGVNAGYLWNDAQYIYDGAANHQITVTGAVRNMEGEVVGLVICDSGRHLEGDACRVITKEELESCYTNAADSSAIISDASF